MTDEELGKYLGYTPEEAAIAIPKLEPERRKAYVLDLGRSPRAS